jgi:Spy/CpxP family protein refolding chaperone
MKKVCWAIGLAFLVILAASTWSSAQMEMPKGPQQGMKMMGEGMMSQEKSEQPFPGMRHQMGCCQMGPGMRMCGMMGGEEEMGCCQGGFFLCCRKELELSDDQVKALKSIRMDFLKGKLKKEADLKISQLELKALTDDDGASLKDIEAKLRMVEKLKADMKLSHIKAFRDAKALLTPEQETKWQEHGGM